MFGKRVLILVAHPDDEVVACAASITRARTSGTAVAALYLTTGCIARETLWPWQRKNYGHRVAARRAEAEAAAALLGIEPLGWATRPARFLWRDLPQIFTEVESAVAQFRPDQLWVPAYEGGNPDHDALNAIGFAFKTRLSVVEFSEYNFFAGHARSHRFIAPDTTTRVTVLTAQEREAKQAALKLYASEKSNLAALGSEQESYRPLASYNYAQPPHQGRMGYARFQWVPFRHPRIDPTAPQQVSSEIIKFLT